MLVRAEALHAAGTKRALLQVRAHEEALWRAFHSDRKIQPQGSQTRSKDESKRSGRHVLKRDQEQCT